MAVLDIFMVIYIVTAVCVFFGVIIIGAWRGHSFSMMNIGAAFGSATAWPFFLMSVAIDEGMSKDKLRVDDKVECIRRMKWALGIISGTDGDIIKNPEPDIPEITKSSLAALVLCEIEYKLANIEEFKDR